MKILYYSVLKSSQGKLQEYVNTEKLRVPFKKFKDLALNNASQGQIWYALTSLFDPNNFCLKHFSENASLKKYFGPTFEWNILYVYINRVSVKKSWSRGWEHGRVKENKKVLYHFANFAIINELLISKNRHIRLTG